MQTPSQQIIFFDGVCNLCNGYIEFLLHVDRKQKFQFASLQGLAASRMLSHNQKQKLHSVIFWQDGQCFEKSDAILAILAELPWPWKITNIFRFLPRGVRDFCYDFIAKYRYRIFGKRAFCRIATSEEKARFLD